MSYTIKYDADGNDEPGTIETLASDGTTIIDTFQPNTLVCGWLVLTNHNRG